MNCTHDMPFGARLLSGGGARFRLWAPDARAVALIRSAGPDAGEAPMRALPRGWFELTVPRADTSTRYAFRIDGRAPVLPDPASRANPDDVHAPSALFNPLAFDWPDEEWRGRPWHEAVIYELHVGTFTPEGSFASAIGRLDDLVALGVTAIELMPVADFAGARGWGYDGVLLFAPEASYGPPEDLKRLVAAAHARGLMVLLDVVYNHFGPDGNYLHGYAGAFFNAEVQTPWGAAIRFDGNRTVREFFIHNALYWIEEYRFDGLRLDAVHAMHDRSRVFIADAIAQALRRGPGRQRHVHLVLESNLNDAARLSRTARGRTRRATAQWNDDVHHAVHVMATGERDGYYVDYADHPPARLGRALAEGFAYQGEPSVFHGGEARGTASVQLPPVAFVNAIQTHDQVGNRAHGERITALAARQDRTQALRALMACTLLSPAVPMLFMGEEFAAGAPFLYFCDFEGDLARAVTEGRRHEFSRFAAFAEPTARATIPDPNDVQTFTRSKLDWRERDQAQHRPWLALYTELLALRREHLVPLLPRLRSGHWQCSDSGTLRLRWPAGNRVHWHMLARLSDTADAGAAGPPGRLIYAGPEHCADALAPWSVQVALERS